MRAILAASLLGAAAIAPLSVPAQTNAASERMLGAGRLQKASDLPAGAFRSRLEALSPRARNRALEWLNGLQFPPEDAASLRATGAGEIYYACTFPAVLTKAAPEQPAATAALASVPISPFPASLKFHSKPGSTNNILFLDFDGTTVSGTAWNSSPGQPTYYAVAFSTDGDYTTYSDSEQAAIKRVWQRVAEDYAPFDIDVTTEAPASFSDRTAQAVITRSTDANGNANPSSYAGGVAYVGAFANGSFANYRPAWVYVDNLSYAEPYIAEAASHEVGHNMGLSHDGTTAGSEYYEGHGSGATSWSSIMGVGYFVDVSQWSKGEYYLANNTQDDLAIIAGKTPYRTDDVGNSIASAGALTITNALFVSATTPESDPTNTRTGNKGVIERNSDADYFAFTSGAGPVSFSVTPWVSPANSRGGNLDLKLSILNSAGATLAATNPPDLTSASLTLTVATGTYYLVVSNAACGTPFANPPSGYTTYASLGQYFINGTVSGTFTNPVNAGAVADGPELARLNWLNVGYDVLIAHATGAPPATPVNGTAYSAGSALASGRVIFKGGGSTAEHVVRPGSTNYYVFYTANTTNHYSGGTTSVVVMPRYPPGIVDAFCYSNGFPLAGAAGGSGFSNAWQAVAGTFYAVTNSLYPDFTFTEPFPRLSSQRLAVDAYTPDTAPSVRRRFAPVTNGMLYFSYRIGIEYGYGGKYSGLRALKPDGTEAFFVGETSGDNILGIDGLGTAGVNSLYGLFSYQFDGGSAYLIAARFNFATRRVDATAYYRTQAVPLAEPTMWEASATAAVDRTAINGIELVTGGFSGGTAGRVYFDEVRVSRNWIGLFRDQPTADLDDDGLPDEWEQMHFGDALAAAPAEDPDGDGFSNADEYAAGTQPTNAASFVSTAWPRVLGTNGNPIVAGDSTPALPDGTDFGSASPCGAPVDHTLSVSNSGNSVLSIALITISASNQFSLLAWPEAVSPGARSNLVLRFSPSTYGAYAGTVSIFHGGSTTPVQFAIQGLGDVVAPPALAAIAPAAPVFDADPPGQNAAGETFDLATNGTPLLETGQCGFGGFGRIYLNYDASYLYLGGEGLDLTADENGMILFLGLDTLTDNAYSPVMGMAFSNQPYGLNLLQNLHFGAPMDIAILLGDEYGDGLYRDFAMGNGMNLGQGVFYLSGDYYGITDALVSQFDGTGTNVTASADDDGNRRTERWKVAIPWSALNAPSGAASISSLSLLGVIAGGTVFDTRYLSANYLAAGPADTLSSLDAYGNIGFGVVTLQPYVVTLPAGDFDHDGLPDGWELRYGLSAVSSNVPDADADDDGFADREEYIADTDPTNELSALPGATSGIPAGVTTLVVDPTSANRQYDIYWKSNLLPEAQPWIAYGLSRVGTGSNIVFTITNDAPRRIYRTGVKLP